MNIFQQLFIVLTNDAERNANLLRTPEGRASWQKMMKLFGTPDEFDARPPFWKPNLRGVDLSGAYLSKVRFGASNMSGANFKHACLSEAKFDLACLVDADFTQAELNKATFYGCDAKKACFYQADLTGAHIAQSSFDEARFRAANLSHTYIYKSSFRRAKFRCATLDKLTLDKVDCVGAVFISASMPDAKFQHDSNCTLADFTNARMKNVEFKDVLLGHANFTNTELNAATFTNVNLTQAIFDNSNIEGAAFSSCNMATSVIKDVDLNDAAHFENVKFPAGHSAFLEKQANIKHVDLLEGFATVAREALTLASVYNAADIAAQPELAESFERIVQGVVETGSAHVLQEFDEDFVTSLLDHAASDESLLADNIKRTIVKDWLPRFNS